MDVPRGQIGPGPAARILVFHLHGRSGAGRLRRMATQARLDAGLLVRREHVRGRPQGDPRPEAGIEVEDRGGLGSEVRVPREEPTPVAPGAQRIGLQPAGDGRAAYCRHQALGQDLLTQGRVGPAGQGHAAPGGQFTRERLDGDDHAGGESGLGARRAAAPPARTGAGARTGAAIY